MKLKLIICHCDVFITQYVFENTDREMCDTLTLMYSSLNFLLNRSFKLRSTVESVANSKQSKRKILKLRKEEMCVARERRKGSGRPIGP